MWEIAKQFDFCYGHRVWSQKLNQEYSLDNRCVCRHLHGHQGTILVHLTNSHLDNGMVTDFKHLNWFKKWLDDTLDHKFIIDKNDPMFNFIIPTPKTCYGWRKDGPAAIGDNWPLKEYDEGYEIIDPNVFKMIDSEELIEILEGFVVVDFVPTSENLTEWIHRIVSTKMQPLGIEVSRIQFFETPKSQANYYGS
jgi:6-pyruvoyltetrahydropterin/6-carboxytetrahydropterin synthase